MFSKFTDSNKFLEKKKWVDLIDDDEDEEEVKV